VSEPGPEHTLKSRRAREVDQNGKGSARLAVTRVVPVGGMTESNLPLRHTTEPRTSHAAPPPSRPLCQGPPPLREKDVGSGTMQYNEPSKRTRYVAYNVRFGPGHGRNMHLCIEDPLVPGFDILPRSHPTHRTISCVCTRDRDPAHPIFAIFCRPLISATISYGTGS
jgi:hypothetical protein